MLKNNNNNCHIDTANQPTTGTDNAKTFKDYIGKTMTTNDLKVGDRIQYKDKAHRIIGISNNYIDYLREDDSVPGYISPIDFNRYLQYGSITILPPIPAEPDILAQLREALGWQEGSIEDVLEVLRYAIIAIGREEEQHIALYDLESAINKNKSV